jgi:hypothetical protein
LTDPLVQVLSLPRPASGQLEVRLPRERLGLLSVRAAQVALTGGASVQMPTLPRGTGARRGAGQTLHGLSETTTITSSLILVETSGIAAATAKVRLFDSTGALRGEAAYPLLRYGYRRIDGILRALGVASGEAVRLDVSVESGEGAVGAIGIVREKSSERGVAFSAQSPDAASQAANLIRAFEERSGRTANALPNVSIVVPVLGTPARTGGASLPSFKTLLQLSSGGLSSVFNLAFRDVHGSVRKTLPQLSVPPGLSLVFPDTVGSLFGLTDQTAGTVSIEATNGGKVSAVLRSATSGQGTPTVSSTLPLLSAISESLTGAGTGSHRPLILDGLEQSVDPRIGSRWMLVLNELAGSGGSVNVRLFESGNRTQAIAEKTFAIAPYEQLTLDTVFGELGLESSERKKDRTNVQVIVLATGGGAKVAASAVSVDNRSGETKVHELQPSGFGSLVSAVTPELPRAPRRRAVRH